MIRFVQLSDFHLNDETLSNWNRFVRESLNEKLSELKAKSPIHFVAFTGDLVDVGGKDFESPEKAFETFENSVIDPLMVNLGLAKEHFYFIPGNHDVVRSGDSEVTEVGLQSVLKDAKKLDAFVKAMLDKGKREGVARMIAYSNFMNQFYEGHPDKQTNFLSGAFRLKVGEHTVGIGALNSSWRCYSSTTDIRQIAISEDQLHRVTSFLKPCDVHIGLVHHPLDWLADVERATVTSHIAKDYDILLCGHVHEGQTAMQTGFSGTLFTNLCPSGLYDLRTDSRRYSNGFTVIDYDPEKREVSCEYYRYNHDQRKFVLNTDLGEEGRFSSIAPDSLTSSQLKLEQRVLKHIRDEHFPEMDKHLMSGTLEVQRKSLSEVFVLPPITTYDEHRPGGESGEDVGMNEILKSDEPSIFIGHQEIGKTVLLYRLVVEFVNQFDLQGCVPVYLHFAELESKDVGALAKTYLSVTKSEWEKLLDSSRVVLFIDDMVFEATPANAALKRVNKFLSEFPNTRVIATGLSRITGTLPDGYLENCAIKFKVHFIKHLQSKEIKGLIRCWAPNSEDVERDSQMEKLVRNFESYSLPSTPMAVSLFLWSMHYSTKKPINHAVLMEIYVEIVLEKLHEHNVYRDSFDFTNKVQLISRIAHDMLLKDDIDYSMTYGDFVKSIERYLKTLVGFNFDSEVLAKYLLDKRIFSRYGGNRVRFSYSCFFNFFLAKRMEFDPDFRDYVMDEKWYHLFHREIDIYTGLVRSDKRMFNTLFDRFEKKFKETDFVFNTKYENHWPNLSETKAKELDVAEVKSNRPDEKAIDAFYDTRLKGIATSTHIRKKQGELALDHLLLIMANVLRNSEGVEDLALKKRAYSSLVKYWLSFTVLYRSYLINYVKEHKAIPKPFKSHANLRDLLVNLPLYAQLGMNQQLGTKKLASIVEAKVLDDFAGKSHTGSEIEHFYSVGLYADIEGPDFPKYLKRFIRGLKSNLVRDFMMIKLLEYYYRRTRPGGSNEVIYLDLLSGLRLRSLGLPARMRGNIIKNLKDSKATFLRKLGK
jgi:predicted MPP superfamily phosphohydrolase